MKLLPMYGYVWSGTAGEANMALVYSEEQRTEILKRMKDDGVTDEYIWFKLERINTNG